MRTSQRVAVAGVGGSSDRIAENAANIRVEENPLGDTPVSGAVGRFDGGGAGLVGGQGAVPTSARSGIANSGRGGPAQNCMTSEELNAYRGAPKNGTATGAGDGLGTPCQNCNETLQSQTSACSVDFHTKT